MATTAERYDEWHETHITGTGPWYEMAADLIRSFDLAKAGDHVLEAGCGEGRFCHFLAQRGAHVVGEDFSSTAIDKAKQSNCAIDFRVGDIENLTHPDDQFDVVVSCEVIEHVPDPKRAVSELARVLKPGGTLVLSTPNYLSLTGLTRLITLAQGEKWDEGGQPLVHWTMWPRTAHWVRRTGLKIYATQGAVWALPFPKRDYGIPIHVPDSLRPWVKLSARHIVLLAR